MVTQAYVNQVAYEIVGCAIEVHKILGPGLLESIYHECMIEEMRQKSLEVQTQLPVAVAYKGKTLRDPLRLDLLVNQVVIVYTFLNQKDGQFAPKRSSIK
jgi:GxxExxY protein